MVSLKFSDGHSNLECWAKEDNTIAVIISANTDEHDFNIVTLNKQDAIKLAKELRKQISFIEEVEE